MIIVVVVAVVVVDVAAAQPVVMAIQLMESNKERVNISGLTRWNKTGIKFDSF